jgi:hypothetical protein
MASPPVFAIGDAKKKRHCHQPSVQADQGPREKSDANAPSRGILQSIFSLV